MAKPASNDSSTATASISAHPRIKVRKRDGSVLTYAYDDLNRAIRKIVPERPGLAAASTRDVYYDYNHALGLMTSARFDSYDGYGVISFYDPFGQPTTSATIMGGPVRYLFRDRDEAGNLAHLTHGDGAQFSYAYDALGRMTLVHDNSSNGSAATRWPSRVATAASLSLRVGPVRSPGAESRIFCGLRRARPEGSRT